MKIILHSDDINLLTYWETICGKDSITIDDIKELLVVKNSIIIINYSAFLGSAQNIILELNRRGNSILILHRIPDIDSAKRLLSFGVNGYGNVLMKGHFLLSAIDAIKEGLVWLHPELTSQLIYQISEKKENNLSSKIEPLSQREKEVVVLLKDGATYKVVAEELDITPRTVKAHANSIYKKLHVKDRLSLALFLK